MAAEAVSAPAIRTSRFPADATSMRPASATVSHAWKEGGRAERDECAAAAQNEAISIK